MKRTVTILIFSSLLVHAHAQKNDFFSLVQQLLSSMLGPSPSPSPSPSPPGSPSLSQTGSPSPTPIVGVNGFGAPLPGLSGDELARFVAGQQQFIAFNGPQNGLGPIFNAQSCLACHTQPVGNAPLVTPTGPDTPALTQDVTVGGGSSFTELRAGFTAPDGSFTALLPDGGTLFHLSSLPALTPPSNGQLPDNILSQEVTPLAANTKAHRRSNALFGFGLLDNIADQTIRNNVHNPPIDGVSGRAADLSSDPVTLAVAASGRAPLHFIGRFGWKCQHATLLAFSADAYRNEMGVTNTFFPRDLAPNGNEAALAAAEPLGFTTDSPDTLVQLTPDSIQDVQDDIAAFTDFMTFLGLPPAIVPLSPQAQNGQRIFSQIGCVLCHTPSMMTGNAQSPALSFQNVPLYSDLLLHDMGTLGDGIPQGAARATEMRTAPLMGLRARTGAFLHDGRARSIPDAILAHDGEAAIVRDRFKALSQSDVNALVSFILSI